MQRIQGTGREKTSEKETSSCFCLCFFCFGKKFETAELNVIGRNFLLGSKKKIANCLMRTFTCHSTFLYGHSDQFISRERVTLLLLTPAVNLLPVPTTAVVNLLLLISISSPIFYRNRNGAKIKNKKSCETAFITYLHMANFKKATLASKDFY